MSLKQQKFNLANSNVVPTRVVFPAFNFLEAKLTFIFLRNCNFSQKWEFEALLLASTMRNT